MRGIWPQHILRELLTLAERTGSASATCGSPREAELLRKALYNFRSANELGLTTTITIEGNDVVLTLPVRPKVEIKAEQ